MNQTIRKFGWPQTLVKELAHWVVLARPAQPTLGSLVLAAKSDAQAFSDLPAGAHAELAEATKAIESALTRAVGYAKINYLMLMMVDNEVHFHVIPRYEGAREWNGRQFPDAGWPKVPDLSAAVALEGTELDQLTGWLREFF
ncbi:HIT family protein [Altericroceibacterium xinjiangense]|uniref:HIT family protein n=1 Tax=Altericroceibacterium xinjiangense TaxID=762261 RepID=UPI000F7EAE57|nr:HIT family protein [Altericroceibacterium xinjiangense]